MKTNIIAKLSTGLLAAIITLGASLAVMRATAAEPETSKAPVAQLELLLTAPRDPSLTHAPPDPDAVLRQIELNVALKQYEKVLMELADTELKIDLGPEEEGLCDQQSGEWKRKQGLKVKILHDRSQQLRAKIEFLIAEGIKAHAETRTK